MLKKTVAGGIVIAAALAMSAAPASAHAIPGSAGVKSEVSSAAQNVQWYGYGYGYPAYTPYAYRSWGYRPYAWGAYPYGGYRSWGYPSGYYGGYGWGY